MKTRVISKAVIFGSDGKILLLRRSKTDTRRPLQWDLPGGAVDEGEDFAAATTREINEESGLHVQPRHTDLIYAEAEADSERGNLVFLFFIAQTDESRVVLSHEHDKFVWMGLARAIQEVQYDRHRRVLQHLKRHNLVAYPPL